MKAARIHEFGSPDVIRIEDAPQPTPNEGEILVRVAAAASGQQAKCLYRRLPTLGRALGSARRGWTARPGEEVIRTSDDPGLEAVAARAFDLIEDGATVGLGSGALYGRSSPSISGASSSGRCSRSGSSPSWRAWRSRRSGTTNALIRRYRQQRGRDSRS